MTCGRRCGPAGTRCRRCRPTFPIWSCGPGERAVATARLPHEVAQSLVLAVQGVCPAIVHLTADAHILLHAVGRTAAYEHLVVRHEHETRLTVDHKAILQRKSIESGNLARRIFRRHVLDGNVFGVTRPGQDHDPAARSRRDFFGVLSLRFRGRRAVAESRIKAAQRGLHRYTDKFDEHMQLPQMGRARGIRGVRRQSSPF